MSIPRFRTVTRTQGANRALKEGLVTPTGFGLDFEEVPVLVDGFRRMVRGLEYDICEMAFTTYLCAKRHGKRFTALPIFLVRAFHHGAICYNPANGVHRPRDLEGRKVGVNRGYTVTTGVWARGILQEECGVDLDKVEWVLSGDEHVEEFQPPENVAPAPPGRKLGAMLAEGELAGAIGIDAPDGTQAFFPDNIEAGLAALRSRGHYPINHLIVVRDDVLAANPGLAPALFESFVEAKRRYIASIQQADAASLGEVDLVHRRVMEVIGDPLPYGIAPNRAMIDTLIGHAVDQHILEAPLDLAELFAHDTLGLTG
jgi:4,5-dihydroxyphthalate decarboxylase